MADVLQRVADIITAAAGWKKAQAVDGVFRFALDDDLEADLSTPEGRTGVLRANLGPLPADEAARDELVRRLGKHAVGTMRTRASTLAVHDGRLELHRTFALTDRTILMTPSPLPDLMQAFLNDLAWWKRQLEGNGRPPMSEASFLSMSMNPMGGFIAP